MIIFIKMMEDQLSPIKGELVAHWQTRMTGTSFSDGTYGDKLWDGNSEFAWIDLH